MDGERLDIEKTLKFLTIEEKLRMLEGDGVWHTVGAGFLPRVRMSDGPNGLRMTDGTSTSALPATCFPTPGMLANSWDLPLMYTVGAAIGREATALGVNLLLAPGVNIKRDPHGGRNFEYYSEDPYLSGVLGKAFISGVQSTGVGACLKHLAVNNQETCRMYANAIVDPRALRELYLKPFEIALEAQPAAVMCAYNKLNGEYCSQNEYLLKTFLREEQGYEGLTISDWGAVRNRVTSFKAGLDLEMPDSLGISSRELSHAYENGEIIEAEIDNSLRRELKLIDDVYLEPYGDYDVDAHDKLSYNAAVESLVLLKNDNGFLPLSKAKSVAVMGSYAESSPVEGEGSSHVVPLKTMSALDSFSKRGIEVTYYKAYSSDEKENARLRDEALTGATKVDAVILFVGTPAPAEGVDRKNLLLPKEQNELIGALTNAGHRVVVVLNTPGPVLMPWVNRVRAILYSGLNGQNTALATVDALYGRVNPRGRLAETFPNKEFENLEFGNEYAPYRESIFVGYKYYDAIEEEPLFAFGHGLGYANIEYGNVRVKRLAGAEFEVSVELINHSPRDAYETVQVYVADRTGRVMRPQKQLAGFSKTLAEGMATTVATVRIDKRAFEFFDANENKFRVCDGEHTVLVGASSADIKKAVTVKVDGDFFGKVDIPQSYVKPIIQNITDDDFERIYGGELPVPKNRPQKGEHTLDSSLNDVRRTLVGRIATAIVKHRAKACGEVGSLSYEAFLNSALHTPLRAVASMSDGAFSLKLAEGLVEMANGKFFKGVKIMLRRNGKNKKNK